MMLFKRRRRARQLAKQRRIVDPHALIDEALDAMTPTYPEDGPHAGQPLGPLDQFAYLATETNVTPDVVLTRLHRRIGEGSNGTS